MQIQTPERYFKSLARAMKCKSVEQGRYMQTHTPDW